MRRMRGNDHDPDALFSYVSPERRVPKDHPLRAIRALVDEVLGEMSREVRPAVCGDGAAVDSAGTAAARAVAANLLLDPQ